MRMIWMLPLLSSIHRRICPALNFVGTSCMTMVPVLAGGGDGGAGVFVACRVLPAGARFVPVGGLGGKTVCSLPLDLCLVHGGVGAGPEAGPCDSLAFPLMSGGVVVVAVGVAVSVACVAVSTYVRGGVTDGCAVVVFIFASSA